jgi:hypothetical protein
VKAGQRLTRLAERVCDQAGQQRPHRVQAVFERRDDAEIATAAAAPVHRAITAGRLSIIPFQAFRTVS